MTVEIYKARVRLLYILFFYLCRSEQSPKLYFGRPIVYEMCDIIPLIPRLQDHLELIESPVILVCQPQARENSCLMTVPDVLAKLQMHTCVADQTL